MVDWNKEVKLSDLIGRKPKEAEETIATAPEERGADEVQPRAEPFTPPAPTPAAPVAVSPAPPVPPAPTQATPSDPEPVPETDPAAAERVPWYKRELSLGSGGARKPKAKKPKVEKPKAEKTKAEKPVKQPKQKKPKGEQVPFYKRELSFGRGGKPRAAKTPKALGGKSQKGSAPSKRVKRVTGLKIGGSQLAAARVHNNGVPELVQVAREALDPGVVVGGELRDPDALAAALKGFFKRHKLPRQGVRLGIANNRIGVRIFDIGGIDDVKQLENAVRFRAHEALPIPIEEAVIDWHILSESQDDDGGITRRILLVVAYRDLLDRYVEACKKAGIKLIGIDLEAFALLRAITEPLAAEAGPASAANVVVAVGHDRSTFAVSDGRVCEFTRVLDWGGATLNVAIARELDIAPSEAEPVKRSLSLTHGDTPEGLTDDQANRAREAVRRQLQSFARELVSSLQFYQNQPDSLGIGEIVLTGGTVHLRGLAEELQTLIGVNVRPGDPLARVKVGKKIKDAEQIGSLAIAIGLGIED
ncbi:MAG: type IV pilus assembly protein PilM [Actinobacteria bacterium]|nr:MAG: type IV pilus assembly protein PilM [Actinomycetota bacterium]